MKLILNTDTFNDSEFDTLLADIKEYTDLQTMIDKVNNNDYEELYIKVQMDMHQTAWGVFDKLPKKMLLQLLELFKDNYENSIKDLLHRTGLEVINND